MKAPFLPLEKMKSKEILILCLCLLLGFALRFYRFDQKSLWVDEIHTLNDSEDGLKGQFEFYKNNPTYLQAPLFFLLTHQFYPFTKPERDLRIIPLIFGTLSVGMMYLLARSFSPQIALPCSLSLAFLTYHISLSQDGRCYTMLMFLGITGLYFFMKYLRTSRTRDLIAVALFLAALFYTSYTSIPFILASQVLWLYQTNGTRKRTLSSFVLLNFSVLVLVLPWALFLFLNYKAQPIMDPLHVEGIGRLRDITYWILNDWVGNLLLIITSALLLILLPFFLQNRKNGSILLAFLVFPVVSLYFMCKWSGVTHFFTSRYFITFLPIFLISVYLSLNAIENKFQRIKGILRLRVIFAAILILSNLIILPLYYRSEKQDFKGLVNFLKSHVREGDAIFIRTKAYLPGVLYYFGARPVGRHYPVMLSRDPGKGLEYNMQSVDHGLSITLYNSESCCAQYISAGTRLWIVVEKASAQELKKNSPCVLKGFFDGRFANFRKFPTDASMYLFLWDPKSPQEKGSEKHVHEPIE